MDFLMSNPFPEYETGPLPHPQDLPSTPLVHPISSPFSLDELDSEETIDYGYRYAHEIGPDGKRRLIMVPLTRDDVIHPQLGDYQLHNDPHQVFCHYLYAVFKAQLHTDPSATVFQDTGIFWDDPKLRHNSPDVTVILGVKKQRRWTSFYVAEEGVRPEIVLEVTSPETWSIDLRDKPHIYEQARVPYYVIVLTDRKTGTRPERLIGYQLTSDGYVTMEADDNGWLWLAPVRLFIGIRGRQVECYEANGKRMGSYSEVNAALTAEAEARAAAERRADAEAETRAAAEARIRDLEAQLRRLQGGAE